MSESVKFIFKSLIKVPVIIVVSYAIFNIFAFFFIYFRMLGISYVVMQTAVDNNFLPQTETVSILNYLTETNNITYVQNVGIIIDDAAQTGATTQAIGGNTYSVIPAGNAYGAVANTATERKQYGGQVYCGVYCMYRIIWPLDYRTTDNNPTGGSQTYTYTTVGGLDGTTATVNGYLPKWYDIPIVITYNVPGLKYYPDLS